MQPLKYTAARDEAAALAIAATEEQAVYVAGGTSLIDLMKLDVLTPTHLIDITPLPLDKITEIHAGVRIGALARNSDVAQHPLIRERYPMLSQALLAGASGQIRNMATMGGNVMQRTRCTYFRDVEQQACNKRLPGSGCAALNGPHRQHAILGTSAQCSAVHPSDLCVALVALDARLQTQSMQGTRSIPLTEFYLLPKDHPERENVLARGEMIVAIDIPSVPFAQRSFYLKVRDRASYAFALVSVAVALDIQAGFIHTARLALGGVATKPWRLYAVEQFLQGQPASAESYHAAVAIAAQEALPRRDNGYKIELMKRALISALTHVGAMDE